MSMHESTFSYLAPTERQQEDMQLMRVQFANLAAIIEAVVPEGRYKSLTITKLEETAMFCNKAITRESDGTPRDGAKVL
jgi:hypothetical protein